MDKIKSSVMTRSFLITLLLGQTLSICLTIGNAASTALTTFYQISMPTTQTLFNYVTIAIIYTSYNIYKNGFRQWLNVLRKRWYIYAVLGLIDVEANYFYVKSFDYTSLLSSMLLDTWTIPVVVVLSLLVLKLRYHILQYVGVAVCVAGMIVLLLSDSTLKTNAPDPVKGDILCLIGATLFGFSNVLEEFMLRRHDFSEVLGQLGLFGTIISCVQLLVVERDELIHTKWSWPVIGLFVLYNVACVSFYTLAPYLFRLAGATFFNLSLLTSDIYGLAVGVFLFNATMTFWYPIAYVWIVGGLIMYNLKQPTDISTLRRPSFVSVEQEEGGNPGKFVEEGIQTQQEDEFVTA